MPLIKANSELDALQSLLKSVLDNGLRVGNYLELTNLLLEIDYDENNWRTFCDFLTVFLEIGGLPAELGWKRATRVYTDIKDRPTKPSYRSRLVSFPDRPKRVPTNGTLNQLDKIASLLAQKPGYSNLSFVILRPADLHDQVRPGYVPCPIAGDFKFRNEKLSLSVMFRTNDAFSVGFADIYYLRKLQIELLEKAKSMTNNEKLSNGSIGTLCLYFSRTYIERYKAIKIRDGKGTNRVEPISLSKEIIGRIDSDRMDERVIPLRRQTL